MFCKVYPIISIITKERNGKIIMKIEEFEQILDIELEVVKNALKEVKLENVALACMGTSPDNRTYIAKLYENAQLEDEIKKLGAVPIVEIEKQQLSIIDKINELL